MTLQNNHPGQITKRIYRKAVLRPVDWIRKVQLQLRGSDQDQKIVIIGSPRSGTTWLFKILNQLPRTGGLYEPLNPRWFPEVPRLGLSSRSYIPPGQQFSAEALGEYFERVFSGRVVSLQPHWPVSPAQTPAAFSRYLLQRIFSKNLVVKMVRATRLLPWLTENFPALDFIYILRHPCSVIASQLQSQVSGYNSREDHYLDYLKVDRLLSREQILVDAANLGIGRHTLERIKGESFSVAGLLALVWCLDNIVPQTYALPWQQDQKSNNTKQSWLTLHYEELLMDYETQLERIEKYFSISPGVLQKQSQVMNRLRPQNPQQQMQKWKNILTIEQIEEIFKIVAWFKIGVDNG